MKRKRHDLAFAFALAGAACAELPQDSAPRVVRALWDPAAARMPSPTDLVRDAQAGRLVLPEDDGLPAAERELRAYLNSLDGFPLSTPVALPVSAPLDPETLAPALRLFDAETFAPVEVRAAFDGEKNLVRASASLLPRRTYLVALSGYEGGAAGTGGETLVSDAAFHFLKSRGQLTEHAAAMPGKTRAERLAAAERLEAVRLRYGPLFDALDARGLGRGSIAVLASFTTTARAAVWFDPASARIPFPNNLLLDRDARRVALPVSETDSDETRRLKAGLSRYDGFSTTAAVVLKSTHPVDRASATAQDAVRLFRIDDGSFAEEKDLHRGVSEDGLTFFLRPRLALEPGARYAYIVTRRARASSGEPLEAQPLGALLRSKAPLVEGGRSQTGSLSDAEAARVEGPRAELAALLDQLDAKGLAREEISAAVPFDTLAAPRLALSMRRELYRRGVPTAVAGAVAATPFERGLLVATPMVKTVVTGRMTTLDFLDPFTRAMREGGPVTSPVEFVLTLPRGRAKGEPIPVVLFAHGLQTSRELVYLVADRLAASGYAAFAIDLPYHGARSVCAADLECAGGASCARDGACVHRDGTPGRLREVASPWPGGPAYPVSSGAAFVDTGDLFASRDHFLQGIVDLSQALRVIRGADWAEATGGYALDGDDVVYLGMSLGGILGAVFAAVEPTLTTFALNVAGAGFVDLMESSSVFGPQLRTALHARGIEPGTPEEFAFQNASRWVLDPVDPVNFAPSGKRLLLQAAQGDMVVPNSATDVLAERLGVEASWYRPLVSNHVFLFDPTSIEGARAREEVVEFFDAR